MRMDIGKTKRVSTRNVLYTLARGGFREGVLILWWTLRGLPGPEAFYALQGWNYHSFFENENA